MSKESFRLLEAMSALPDHLVDQFAPEEAKRPSKKRHGAPRLGQRRRWVRWAAAAAACLCLAAGLWLRFLPRMGSSSSMANSPGCTISSQCLSSAAVKRHIPSGSHTRTHSACIRNRPHCPLCSVSAVSPVPRPGRDSRTVSRRVSPVRPLVITKRSSTRGSGSRAPLVPRNAITASRPFSAPRGSITSTATAFRAAKAPAMPASGTSTIPAASASVHTSGVRINTAAPEAIASSHTIKAPIFTAAPPAVPAPAAAAAP